MSTSMRIVVAEDHAMVRAGLVEIINGFPEFEVVGEAGTGKTAVAAASRLKPDVMVLDLDMPDTCDPLLPREQTTSEVLAASPTTKIIILTMHDDPSTVRDLLRAGASGYLAKTAGPDELRGALKATARGDDSIFIGVPRRTMVGLSDATAPATDRLTARELEILAHVATGSSNRALAGQLHIAEATVKRHLDSIFKKLNVNSRINAVNRARELHIL